MRWQLCSALTLSPCEFYLSCKAVRRRVILPRGETFFDKPLPWWEGSRLSRPTSGRILSFWVPVAGRAACTNAILFRSSLSFHSHAIHGLTACCAATLLSRFRAAGIRHLCLAGSNIFAGGPSREFFHRAGFANGRCQRSPGSRSLSDGPLERPGRRARSSAIAFSEKVLPSFTNPFWFRVVKRCSFHRWTAFCTSSHFRESSSAWKL